MRIEDQKAKCPWVLAAGKAGLIIGMLSELHRETGPSSDLPPSFKHTPDWRLFIPLPCRCAVCYAAFETAIHQGRRHRVKTEDFTRYSSQSVIATATVSKLNQAIVSLLPDLYPHFDRKPWS
jgi:hypothetical protein